MVLNKFVLSTTDECVEEAGACLNWSRWFNIFFPLIMKVILGSIVTFHEKLKTVKLDNISADDYKLLY
jgi:hypothetical protein